MVDRLTPHIEEWLQDSTGTAERVVQQAQGEQIFANLDQMVSELNTLAGNITCPNLKKQVEETAFQVYVESQVAKAG